MGRPADLLHRGAAGLYLLFPWTTSYLKRHQLAAFLNCDLCFTSAPNLLLESRWGQFRVFPFQYFLVGHWIFTGWYFAFRRLRATSWRWGLAALAGIAFVYTLLSARWIVREGLVEPHASEYSAYQEYVEAQFEPGQLPSFIAFILPFGPSTSRVPQIHEYGLYSSFLDWVPHGLASLLLRERAGLTPVPQSPQEMKELKVRRIFPWQKRDVTSIPVIDGFVARYGHPAPPIADFRLEEWIPHGRSIIQDPYFGEVEELNDGWLYAESVGYIQNRPSPAYWHWSLGWILPRAEGIWIQTDKFGWVLSSREQFPEAEIQGTDTRVRLHLTGYQEYRAEKLKPSP